MSFVEIDRVGVSYGGRTVLERVSARAAEGEFTAILGPSGCGKSTLLRLLVGQERPTSGTIRVAGEPPPAEPDRTRGIVFQRYSVFPHMTVRENLVAAEALGSNPLGRLFGAARRAARIRADDTLERIGLAGAAADHPAALSGGMRQRLAIAQALAARPRILLLDEPFGALDPGTRGRMHGFLGEMRRETGMTVFMVTHDLREGFALADRVLVLDKPRWDPHAPDAWGATVTYDIDTRRRPPPPEDPHVPLAAQ